MLHTALQVVSDANTLLTPFLPHAAQKVHEALGGAGVWAAQPEIRTVVGGGRPGLPGADGRLRRRAGPLGASIPIEAGKPLAKPTPLFAKLDEKLGQTGPDFARLDLSPGRPARPRPGPSAALRSPC